MPPRLDGPSARGLALAFAGTVCGLIAALILGRFVSKLLFGVSPTDPATMIATAIVLLVVSLLAALIPARRASRVNPIVALRSE